MTTQSTGGDNATARGRTAVVICTDFGVEEAELTRPVDALREAGVQVTIAAVGGSTIQTVTGDKDRASTVQPDAALEDVVADEFDIVVVPGGTVNADTLRGNEHARKLLRAFADSPKPIAAICHAPWILIDAGLAAGKTLTSYESLSLDLANAGATWLDTSVYRCPADGWVLITSRNPGDLDDFNDAILHELQNGADAGR
ncbi:type 1 glutamine amidotransferase domain-containing protein [Microlunatus soli]|uniref:Protease I n=1 Tax=Microlunatus soli TaxID=630515 RepID=A0A1H1U4L8_9ACTN|nr:type 1 glutamine amidotransferase domain-containing protein [Microlunatus soli]SDS67236.1 protease I [Microlunatus soli]